MPQQIVASPRTCKLSYISQEDLPKELARPFNLERDLLIRAALIKNSPDEHLLFYFSASYIFDGWSRDILIRDLAIFLSIKNTQTN